VQLWKPSSLCFCVASVLTNAPTLAPERVLACSMPLLERIKRGLSGTTLSWQCSHSTTNAISEVLLFFSLSLCVMRYIFICILFALVPELCVCVCVCVQCNIYLYLRRSIYIPIYVSRMYLRSICSWPLSCQRCLCWSLPCVCVCVCVCVLNICDCFESWLLDRCSRRSIRE
jgi:hypothetical protein